jgi:hypothetical protein
MILKFMNYWTTLPSREGHCCDCEQCWRKDKCSAELKRRCMVCKHRAIIGYVLEDENRKEKANHTGSIPFWVCDEHNEDPDLEDYLRKGIDSKEVKWNTRMGYIMLNAYQPPEEYKDHDFSRYKVDYKDVDDYDHDKDLEESKKK